MATQLEARARRWGGLMPTGRRVLKHASTRRYALTGHTARFGQGPHWREGQAPCSSFGSAQVAAGTTVRLDVICGLR